MYPGLSGLIFPCSRVHTPLFTLPQLKCQILAISDAATQLSGTLLLFTPGAFSLIISPLQQNNTFPAASSKYSFNNNLGVLCSRFWTFWVGRKMDYELDYYNYQVIHSIMKARQGENLWQPAQFWFISHGAPPLLSKIFMQYFNVLKINDSI